MPRTLKASELKES